MKTITRSCDAMATRFEWQLAGDDDEHLDAVASAIVAEIERLDRLLSRFDPRSEVSRVNRLATREPVIVDAELFAILETCLQAAEATHGFFNVTASPGGPVEPCAMTLDPSQRTVQFAAGATRLDFGAVGKGYALDCAAEILRAYHVESALLHGGTSSVLAVGGDPEGQPWRIGIAEPWIDGAPARDKIAEVLLESRAVSTSSAMGGGAGASDIVDPTTGQPLSTQNSCTVLAPTATEAEILSTALLAMGRARAAAYTESLRHGDRAVGWTSVDDGMARFTWL